MTTPTVLLDPNPGVPVMSSTPCEENDINYRLDVVASDVADVVSGAGGWLYDRRAAGWEVNVFVPQIADPRPLRILGARTWAVSDFVSRRCASHGLAVSAAVFTGEPRVRERVQAALDSVAADVALWGDGWPLPVQRTVQHAQYRLSAAAQLFKGHALTAAGVAHHASATEAFLCDLGPCLPVEPDLVPRVRVR